MQALLPPLSKAIADDLESLCPGSTLGGIEVLRYRHTIEKRGSGLFRLHECLVLCNVEKCHFGDFLLSFYCKVRKSGWELMALECGDRFNPPPPGFQFFDHRPTAAEIGLFVAARSGFRLDEEMQVLTDWVADELD